MLSDVNIDALMTSGRIQISPPPSVTQLQPASVDLVLGQSEKYKLKPHRFTLASTLELIGLPDDHSAMVAGKSSLARLGLVVESAGFVDPGFRGQITLELFNMSSKPITLKIGMPICQIVFFKLESPALRPYGHPKLNSHYQNQRGPTKSWMART